jgi:hypothetical protein
MAGSGHHHLDDMSFDESRSNMKSIKSAQHTLGFRVVSTQQLFGIFKPTVGATAFVFHYEEHKPPPGLDPQWYAHGNE